MGRLVDDARLRRTVELARAAGMTQKAIAQTCGISRDIIREIVTGRPSHRRKPAAEIAEHNYSTYNNHGCRCHECTAACAAYNREYTAERRHRTPTSPIRFDPVMFDLPEVAHRQGRTEWEDLTGDTAAQHIDGGDP